MAINQYWGPVQQAFTANGTEDGLITVENASGFYIQQYVQVSATGQPILTLEVKGVPNVNSILVGPQNAGIGVGRTSVSAYTTANSAQILAPQQLIPTVRPDDVENLTFEREPAKARRVELVDQVGYPYQSIIDNSGVHRLPVDANLSIGELNVDVSYPSALTIYNNVISASATEYSYALPSKTQRFSLKVRDGSAKIQFSFTSGASNTNFITVPMGCEFSSGDLAPSSSLTIYYQANQSGKIIEILTWQNFS